MIDFRINTKPRGKGRPRFTRTGHCFTDKNTLEFEKEVRDAFLTANELYEIETPIEAPLRVEIDIDFQPNESDSKRIRKYKLDGIIKHTKKPDIDNVIKAVLDGLNGVLYKDDSQIIELTARKRFSEVEGITVRIFEYK